MSSLKLVLMLLLEMAVITYSQSQPDIVNPSPPPEPPVRKRRLANERIVGTIARAKCAEYSAYTYQTYYPPPTLPNSEPMNVLACVVREKQLRFATKNVRPMEFPHMAAVGFIGNNEEIVWICSGTLVSDRFVLTAAHCTHSRDLGAATKIRVGDLNLIETNDIANPQDRDIIERIKHRQYKPPAGYDDIGLLKMDKPVEFNIYVRPACLPYSFPDVQIPRDKVIEVAWGHRAVWDDEGSLDLRKTIMHLTVHANCSMSYGTSIKFPAGINPESQICATQNGVDPCQTNSGGPLEIFNQDFECMHTVIGVGGYGRLCRYTSPDIYTRVNYYIQWLEDMIWPERILIVDAQSSIDRL